jgi:hypothetical protein
MPLIGSKAVKMPGGIGGGSNKKFTSATGGTITTVGDYKIHTFTSPGTFTVTQAGNAPTNPVGGPATVDYLVVAGGGGGAFGGGGGGAGGFRESVPSPAAWTGSPLANPGAGLTVTAQGYPVTVGSGGAGGVQPGPQPPGANGSDSVFSTITSTGGGGGGALINNNKDGNPGGSGGGAKKTNIAGPVSAGSGNTPPVSPPQGNPGGPVPQVANQGGKSSGGGAGAPGGSGNSAGGAGVGTAFNPSPSVGTPGPDGALRYFGGGGGSAITTNPSSYVGPAAVGGGGAAKSNGGNPGTANTGGGGGGTAGNPGTAGSGGSGIVMIRYKYQ